MGSGEDPGTKKDIANSDINQHLSDAGLSSNLNSLDFSRLVIQLQSVLEFAKDRDAADPASLLRNFEQALCRKTNLNPAKLTVEFFQALIEHILAHLGDYRATLQYQQQTSVVETLLRVMHEFLLFSASNKNTVQNEQPCEYYLPGTTNPLFP